MSHTNQTGVTENGQIWKKVLAGFISQILILKRPKYKKIPARSILGFLPPASHRMHWQWQPHPHPPWWSKTLGLLTKGFSLPLYDADGTGEGQRMRTDDMEVEGGQPINPALLLSIEKLQEIQDEIERVSHVASKVIYLPFFGTLVISQTFR
jgi:hypothetical protein